MPTVIALLRGVNVGGRFVKMDRLRALFEEMGFSFVRTFIQSGNVLFDGGQTQPSPELSAYIEAELRASLGFEVAVLTLSPQALAAVLAANPFADRALVDPERLHITLLKDDPTAEAVAKLKPNPASADEYSIIGRAVWILCRNGYGRTVYTNSFFESKLKTAATTRNLETMGALVEMAEEKRD
jgi:uncharacterized protein (DUF1697 family)